MLIKVSIAIVNFNAEKLLTTYVYSSAGVFCDKKCLKEVMKGKEIVFHRVSTMVPVTSNDNPIFNYETNVLGSLRVFEARKKMEWLKLFPHLLAD